MISVQTLHDVHIIKWKIFCPARLPQPAEVGRLILPGRLIVRWKKILVIGQRHEPIIHCKVCIKQKFQPHAGGLNVHGLPYKARLKLPRRPRPLLLRSRGQLNGSEPRPGLKLYHSTHVIIPFFVCQPGDPGWLYHPADPPRHGNGIPRGQKSKSFIIRPD